MPGRYRESDLFTRLPVIHKSTALDPALEDGGREEGLFYRRCWPTSRWERAPSSFPAPNTVFLPPVIVVAGLVVYG